MKNMRISQLTASLANLDDIALWLQTKAAAEQEKQCCAAVIAHIAELKKRKLFLSMPARVFLTILASRLSEENKEQLLPACHGKTKHQESDEASVTWYPDVM